MAARFPNSEERSKVRGRRTPKFQLQKRIRDLNFVIKTIHEQLTSMENEVIDIQECLDEVEITYPDPELLRLEEMIEVRMFLITMQITLVGNQGVLVWMDQHMDMLELNILCTNWFIREEAKRIEKLQGVESTAATLQHKIPSKPVLGSKKSKMVVDDIANRTGSVEQRFTKRDEGGFAGQPDVEGDEELELDLETKREYLDRIKRKLEDLQRDYDRTRIKKDKFHQRVTRYKMRTQMHFI